MLLAFKQNGELLTPDHGFPLRTLFPGCIGGRMIKWLCSMWAPCLHILVENQAFGVTDIVKRQDSLGEALFCVVEFVLDSLPKAVPILEAKSF